MASIGDVAMHFIDACDTGQGWTVCQNFCHPHASFSAQCEQLAGFDSLEEYCDWMVDFMRILPNGKYELKSFGIDEARQSATIFSVFSGTHTGDGGPVPPTGRSVAADYVYAIEFTQGRINHITKIWNAPWSMQELGWA